MQENESLQADPEKVDSVNTIEPGFGSACAESNQPCETGPTYTAELVEAESINPGNTESEAHVEFITPTQEELVEPEHN